MSVYKGFPNTFLQAFLAYVQVVCLKVNPDGKLKKYNIGVCPRNIDWLTSDIKMFLTTDCFREEMDRDARQYFEKNHSVDRITQLYYELFW